MRKLKKRKIPAWCQPPLLHGNTVVRTRIDSSGIRQDGGSFKLVQQDAVAEAKRPGSAQRATVFVRRAESTAFKDDNVIVAAAAGADALLRKDSGRTAIAARDDGVVESGEAEGHADYESG